MQEAGIEAITRSSRVNSVNCAAGDGLNLSIPEQSSALGAQLQRDPVNSARGKPFQNRFWVIQTGDPGSLRFVRKEYVEMRQHFDGTRIGEPIFAPADVE